ncbi:MAG: BspA family leucine-rich repeat surface protein [Atopobiaceae bacterium]|nr:BspA family leucine-rich repeat surface protein [Atopobiaceae bacterium]
MRRNEIWHGAARAVAAVLATCAVAWGVAPATALAQAAGAAGEAIEVVEGPVAAEADAGEGALDDAAPYLEAQDGLIASGTCGTSQWEIAADGTLTLFEGELASYDQQDQWPWHEHRSDITAIKTSGTVVAGTSLRSAFKECKRAVSADLTGLDTSNVTDMGLMFGWCTHLTSLDLSGWDTSKVENMQEMFALCYSLPSLDLSGFDTSSVKDMEKMFYLCTELPFLDLSGFDTSSVTDMSGMFVWCDNLTSLDLSSWNTSNVTTTHSLFAGCENLASVDLTGWDTSNVTDMVAMFTECPLFTSLDLSGFDTSKVTDFNFMFDGCEGLTSLNLSGWDTSNVTNMATMFNGCKSLASLDLSSFDTSSVTEAEEMFDGCAALASLTVGPAYEIKSADMFPDATSERGWWSTADRRWYTKGEVVASRSKVADTYESAGVEPADISGATVSVEGQTYTGQPLEPAPAVTLGGEALVAGTDYDVSYADNVGAGTATVTVTGKGGYEGTAQGTFAIAKAASSVSLAAQTKTYTGKALAYGGKVTRSGSAGAITYRYYSDAGCTKAVKASSVKGAGTYYVRATVAADANHKAATSAAAKLVVKRAANPLSVKAVARTAKLSAVSKKATVVARPLSVANKAKSRLTYAKAKGSASCLAVDKTTGKVTVRKGTKKGTYAIKIKVTAAKTANHNAASKTVTAKVTVK